MLSIIIQNLSTIVVSLIILALVVLAINKMRKDRKKGKTCGCGCCSNCPGSSICHH